MAQKLALYRTIDTDGDAFREGPDQLHTVQPGDLVINNSGVYVPAASLPGFLGFVDQLGEPWPA